MALSDDCSERTTVVVYHRCVTLNNVHFAVFFFSAEKVKARSRDPPLLFLPWNQPRKRSAPPNLAPATPTGST